MYNAAQAAGRTAEQRKRDNMIIILQAGFFDYAAMIAERGEPEKAAASVKILNSTIELIRSADSGSVEFTKAVLEDSPIKEVKEADYEKSRQKFQA